MPWQLAHRFGNHEKSKAEARQCAAAVLRERQIRNDIKENRLMIVERTSQCMDYPDLTCVTLEEIIKTIFPREMSDRLDRSLVNLSKLSPTLGHRIILGGEGPPVVFAGDVTEMLFMVSALAEDGYVVNHGANQEGGHRIEVTAKGWNRVSDIQRHSASLSLRQAFVAMSFQRDLLPIWEQGLESGIKDAKYTALRIDLKDHNNFIPDEIIAEIRRSRFLVADFTGQKHGVYFEAGFALGLGIPVIWTCRADEMEACHFDTKQYNHIKWESAEDLRRSLANRIRATIV